MNKIATLVVIAFLSSSVSFAGKQGEIEEGFSEANKAMNEGLQEMINGLGTMGATFEEMLEGMEGLADQMVKENGGELTTDLVKKNSLIELPVQSIKHIDIITSKFNDIQFGQSETDEIQILIQAFSDKENEGRLEALLRSVKLHVKGDLLVIDQSISSYFCSSSNGVINGSGKLSAKGACFGDLIINIPDSSRISISFEGESINGIQGKAMDINSFIQRLNSASFTSDKEELLNTFIATRNSSFELKADEMNSVLEIMSFSSNKMDAFKKLGPYVPKPERLKLIKVIDEQFIGSDEDRATEILISLP